MGDGSEKGQYHSLASGVLSGKLILSTRPDASHFSFFLYAMSALPAAALMLHPVIFSKEEVPYFLEYKTHSPPPNLGRKLGCVLQSECSLPGLLGEGGRQWNGVFFPYFPLLKPRCVLWSSASYSPPNTVSLHKS